MGCNKTFIDHSAYQYRQLACLSAFPINLFTVFTHSKEIKI